MEYRAGHERVGTAADGNRAGSVHAVLTAQGRDSEGAVGDHSFPGWCGGSVSARCSATLRGPTVTLRA